MSHWSPELQQSCALKGSCKPFTSSWEVRTMQMLGSTLTSLHREDIPYTIASRGLSAPQSLALHQELAGAKLRPSREQSMTFARRSVSDTENYSNCSQKAGTYLPETHSAAFSRGPFPVPWGSCGTDGQRKRKSYLWECISKPPSFPLNTHWGKRRVPQPQGCPSGTETEQGRTRRGCEERMLDRGPCPTFAHVLVPSCPNLLPVSSSDPELGGGKSFDMRGGQSPAPGPKPSPPHATGDHRSGTTKVPGSGTQTSRCAFPLHGERDHANTLSILL